MVDPAAVEPVSAIIDRHARQLPDVVAMRFEGRDTNYRDLRRRVLNVANLLDAHGVGQGTRIAYVGRNSDVYFWLLYAAARVGAVMVPVGWRLAPMEIAYIINDTQGTVVFADAASIGQLAALRHEMPGVRHLIATEPAEGVSHLLDLLSGFDEVDKFDPDNAERVFLQLYTSGTTGHPKGVMLNARTIFAVRDACKADGVNWDQWTHDDVGLVAMPIAHIGGSGYGLMCLYHGARAFIVREFTPEIVLDAIENEGVSKFFIVPTALQIISRHPRARQIDYSRVKHILYGASPMPLPLLREALEVFGAGLVQNYGMTETAGTIVALPAEDHHPAGNDRMKSAGKALPGVELRIVDPAGNAVATGTVGEIVTRSASNMVGYWNRPDQTASTVDLQGWLHTGDAGYLDADGYLYISDRIKDMVCSGGENVYPAEVEAVLHEHPQIAEVAVIGVPDEKWGEAVKAIVVPRAGATINPAEVIVWARSRLAGFKLPKSIEIVEQLPRNASGKVLKKTLREPWWQGRERSVN